MTGLSRLNEQVSKIREQYDHLKEQALGHVGALTSPLTDLAALPSQIVGDGLAWRDDFAGTDTAGLIDALDSFSTAGTPLTDYWRDRLNAAPATTEADVIAEYDTLPVSLADRAAENYRRQRNQGEQRTALGHAVNTAASDTTATVLSARDSYAALRGQTNTSGTALQQAQIAGLITSGEVSAARPTRPADRWHRGTPRRRRLALIRRAVARSVARDHSPEEQPAGITRRCSARPHPRGGLCPGSWKPEFDWENRWSQFLTVLKN